jgi:hypothetical protein
VLALESIIVARLREALSEAWAVKGLFSDAGKRDADLLASVAFADADVPSTEATGVLVQPYWTVTLTGKRSDADTATQLDAAFGLCIEGLHNWAPGAVAGLRWKALRLVRVKSPPYPEHGLVGLELAFSTSALYDGQP